MPGTTAPTAAVRIARAPAPRARWRSRHGPARAALGCALIALIAALALAEGHSAPASHRLSHPARAQAMLVPAGLASAASSSIGAAQRGFWALRRGAAVVSRGGAIHATFAASGVTIAVPDGRLALSFAALRRGAHQEAVRSVSPQLAAGRVLYHHGSVLELYRNGPAGLEQEFTLARRPLSGASPLVLELRTRGSLSARQLGARVAFARAGARAALSYGALAAFDASGRRLAAEIRIVSGGLELRIQDTHARYPLRIDPLIQQGGKLTGSGEIGEGALGIDVAVSANGNTALVGGSSDNGGTGAAWVFTRSGETWTQQTKLIASSELGHAEFGESVALSADGNTALIGGEGDSEGKGAAWVFTRVGSAWGQQAKLSATGEIGKGNLGVGVALSAAGDTALIGGPRDNSGKGAAWVFTRSGSAWTQRAKLTGEGEIGNAQLGQSVALSGNGATALAGGGADNASTGAVWAFARSGETWSQQAKITAEGEIGEADFGARGSLALSADGGTALIGGLTYNNLVGGAWVFKRAGETWAQQAKLTGGGEVGKGAFGRGVALSGGGNVALVGALGDSANTGASWAFSRSGSAWTQQQKITASGESGKAQFGTSAALSSDGSTVLIGGPRDNTGVGAAWAFVYAPPTVSTGEASQVTQTSATLNATVNPGGAEVSECTFEYGTTSEYGSSAACSSPPGSGSSPVAVTAPVASLSPGTTYHFRIAAANASGRSTGSDQSLTTLAPSPPTATTGEANNVTQMTATLNATVNPNGAEVTECTFEYGLTTTYGSSASCSALPGSGSSPVAVSAPISGLLPGTTYHFRIAAANANGPGSGADQTFTTVLANAPPAATTGEASQITQTSARLEGTVNPNSAEVSECTFEYGTTTAYGLSASCSVLPGSGSSPVAVSAPISGLGPATTYHFRLVATSANGTGKGNDQSFKTLLPRPPTVTTGAASQIGQTSATLNATVNPNGGEVSECTFEYGSSTAYSSSAACSPPPGGGTNAVAVTAAAAGLSPNATYHFRVVAANANGPSAGADQTFKTATTGGPPPAIAHLSPNKGPAAGGITVTITGTNFAGVKAVDFGAAAASFSATSQTSITAVSPPGRKGTVDVTVTTGAGTSAISKKDHFKYVR